MPATEQHRFARRGWQPLRWTRRFLFLTGTAAVLYVALTLLYADHFQRVASDVLEKQMSAQEQHGLKPSVPKRGDVLGFIEIPRLGVKVAILEGTTQKTLLLGVGHIEGTPLPGDPGNAGIAGHRDTYFRALRNIRAGDKIQILTAAGSSLYVVDWTRIVAPEDTEILTPSSGSAITLVTCYPFYYIGAAPERFVVHAVKG